MSTLPTDPFSLTLRALRDNPGAVRAESTINLHDMLGNNESWIVTTFRHDGRATGFLQRNAADGSFRLVLPPEVMSALAAQRDRVVTQARKHAARRAVDTRRERGDVLGNPDALAKARRSRAKKGRSK